MKCLLILAVFEATLILSTQSVLGEGVPSQVNYQGMLRDLDTGEPLTGTFPITFSLYSVESGSGPEDPRWIEDHLAVQVVNGLFNVILGEFSPLTPELFDDSERWLQITVDGESISGRTKMVCSPYAFHAAKADTAEHLAEGAGDGDWVIDGDDIYRVAGTVTIGASSPYSGSILRVVDSVPGTDVRLGGAVALVAVNASESGNGATVAQLATSGCGLWAHNEDIENSGFLGTDTAGVFGWGRDSDDVGVGGFNHNSYNRGYLANDSAGACGVGYSADDVGVLGANAASGNSGYLGGQNHAVYGINGNGSNKGYLGGDTVGVYGEVTGSGEFAVLGKHTGSGTTGYLGLEHSGVYGLTSLASQYAVFGYNANGNYGYLGGDSVCVYGNTYSSADWAAFLEGKVFVDDRFYIDNDEFFLDCDVNPDRPILNWDERDYQSYDRTNDVYKFHIDLSSIFEINSDGVCWNGTSGSCSDSRFKKNIRPLHNVLGLLSEIRGVEFEWKQSEFPDRPFGSGEEIGFIAQELEQVLPELVSRDSEGYRYVDYARMTPLLVEAIKQLKAENDELKQKTDQIETLESRVAELSSMVKKLMEPR